MGRVTHVAFLAVLLLLCGGGGVHATSDLSGGHMFGELMRLDCAGRFHMFPSAGDLASSVDFSSFARMASVMRNSHREHVQCMADMVGGACTIDDEEYARRFMFTVDSLRNVLSTDTRNDTQCEPLTRRWGDVSTPVQWPAVPLYQLPLLSWRMKDFPRADAHGNVDTRINFDPAGHSYATLHMHACPGDAELPFISVQLHGVVARRAFMPCDVLFPDECGAGMLCSTLRLDVGTGDDTWWAEQARAVGLISGVEPFLADASMWLANKVRSVWYGAGEITTTSDYTQLGMCVPEAHMPTADFRGAPSARVGELFLGVVERMVSGAWALGTNFFDLRTFRAESYDDAACYPPVDEWTFMPMGDVFTPVYEMCEFSGDGRQPSGVMPQGLESIAEAALGVGGLLLVAGEQCDVTTQHALHASPSSTRVNGTIHDVAVLALSDVQAAVRVDGGKWVSPAGDTSAEYAWFDGAEMRSAAVTGPGGGMLGVRAADGHTLYDNGMTVQVVQMPANLSDVEVHALRHKHSDRVVPITGTSPNGGLVVYGLHHEQEGHAWAQAYTWDVDGIETIRVLALQEDMCDESRSPQAWTMSRVNGSEPKLVWWYTLDSIAPQRRYRVFDNVVDAGSDLDVRPFVCGITMSWIQMVAKNAEKGQVGFVVARISGFIVDVTWVEFERGLTGAHITQVMEHDATPTALVFKQRDTNLLATVYEDDFGHWHSVLLTGETEVQRGITLNRMLWSGNVGSCNGMIFVSATVADQQYEELYAVCGGQHAMPWMRVTNDNCQPRGVLEPWRDQSYVLCADSLRYMSWTDFSFRPQVMQRVPAGPMQHLRMLTTGFNVDDSMVAWTTPDAPDTLHTIEWSSYGQWPKGDTVIECAFVDADEKVNASDTRVMDGWDVMPPQPPAQPAGQPQELLALSCDGTFTNHWQKGAELGTLFNMPERILPGVSGQLVNEVIAKLFAMQQKRQGGADMDKAEFRRRMNPYSLDFWANLFLTDAPDNDAAVASDVVGKFREYWTQVKIPNSHMPETCNWDSITNNGTCTLEWGGAKSIVPGVDRVYFQAGRCRDNGFQNGLSGTWARVQCSGALCDLIRHGKLCDSDSDCPAPTRCVDYVKVLEQPSGEVRPALDFMWASLLPTRWVSEIGRTGGADVTCDGLVSKWEWVAKALNLPSTKKPGFSMCSLVNAHGGDTQGYDASFGDVESNWNEWRAEHVTIITHADHTHTVEVDDVQGGCSSAAPDCGTGLLNPINCTCVASAAFCSDIMDTPSCVEAHGCGWCSTGYCVASEDNARLVCPRGSVQNHVHDNGSSKKKWVVPVAVVLSVVGVAVVAFFVRRRMRRANSELTESLTMSRA